MLQDNSFSEEESFTKSLGKRAQTCHHDFPSILMPSLLNLDLMSHRNHPKIISEIITWRELQLQEKLCPTWNLILWSQRTVWEVQGYSTYICISHLCQTMVMSPQNMKHYRILKCNLFFQVFLISFLWTSYFLTYLSHTRIINVNHPQPCLYLRKCLFFSVQFSLCVHSALQSVSLSFLSIICDILLSCLSTTSMCCSLHLRHLCKYPGLLNLKSKISKPHNLLKPWLYFLPFLISFYFSGFTLPYMNFCFWFR